MGKGQIVVRLKKTVLSSSERLHGLTIPVVGLTGGIASGKSTVASFLHQEGFPVISADALIKDIYAKEESQAFCRRHFPDCFIGEQVDFRALRQKAFNSREAREKLEKFLYPQLIQAFKQALKRFSSPRFIIYDVPLLFEKSLHPLVDLSVCVYCDKDSQRQRLLQRDGITRDLAEKMLAEQMDIELKKNKADAVINNFKDLEELKLNTRKFIKEYFDFHDP